MTIFATIATVTPNRYDWDLALKKNSLNECSPYHANHGSPPGNFERVKVLLDDTKTLLTAPQCNPAPNCIFAQMPKKSLFLARSHSQLVFPPSTHH